MRLLRMLVALAALVFGPQVPAPALAADDTCPPGIVCEPDLIPASEPICYVPGDACRIDVLNRWGAVPDRTTVHYRTFLLDAQAVDYVPVPDAVLTIERGQSGGQAIVPLVPNPLLPEERFGLEVYAPSAGTVGNPRTPATIMRR